MRPPQNPVALALLSGVALLYGGAVNLRNRYYGRPGASHRAPLPVLSVGNLTVGGTGKTPLVAWVARQLVACGHEPAIVSRGYGGTVGKGPLIVSEGSGPRCSAAVCGDEPYLLATMLPGVRVVAGSDRRAGAAAARSAGADVAILDDGFQHRGLARDLDIVLLDASNPFGNYRLLPAGLLREPVHALARADVVVITRSAPGDPLEVIKKVVRHHNARVPLLRAGHRPLGFFDAAGRKAETPAAAVVFCGIGNPNRFRIDLENEGVEIVAFEAHRDHHPYALKEIRKLDALARKAGVPLVTTEKDMARLGPAGFPPELDALPLLALRIEAVLFDAEPLMQAIRQAAEQPRR